MLSLRTNLTQTRLSQYAKEIAQEKNKTLEKVATGKKINRAADDPSGLILSERLQRKITSSKQSIKNIENGIQFLQVSDQAVGKISILLQRMRELAQLASNETFTNEQKEVMNKEFELLKKEINRMYETTIFNEKKVLKEESIPGNEKPGKLADIVFLIDNTGSMAPYQMNVANQLQTFINSLTGAGINDLRFGSVEYTDDETNIQNFSGSKWTTNGEEIVETIEQYATNNRGGTENIMQAFLEIVNQYDFRPQNKHIIFVTNEDADDQEKTNQAILALQAKGVQVHGAYYTTDGNASELHSIVDATEGAKVNLSDPNWGSQLTTTIGNKITSQIGSESSLGMIIHSGAEENDRVGVAMYEVNTEKLEIHNNTINTTDEALQSIVKIDSAIEKIIEMRNRMGSDHERLLFSKDNQNQMQINNTQSLSRIQDANEAIEISQLVHQQIKETATLHLLSQSTEEAKTTLQLLVK